MHRRKFLKLAAAGGIATSVAGCSSDEDPSPEPPTETQTSRTTAGTTSTPDLAERVPYGDQFETVIDLQRAGADPEAEESIVPLLEEYIDDDTLVYLPSGHYLMDNTVQRLEFENLGIVGHDAIVVPADGFNSPFFDLGRPDEAAGLLFEGVNFDFNAPDAGSRPLSALVDDDLVVRDLVVTGTQAGGSGMLRVDVTNEDGTGLVERARLLDGAKPETDANGCLVGDENRGHIRFENCQMEGFPDNGLYADPAEGSIEVIGGYYANCNVSCIRVANDSVVRGVRVRCDRAPEEYGNMRGIRVTHAEGALVENCVIELLDVAGSDGAITFGKALTSATIRDSRIVIDADYVNAIQVKHPENVPDDEPITIEDVSITGSAANESAVEVNERQNCTFENVSIEQDGENRDGMVFDRSNASIRDCEIQVTGEPIVAPEDATVNVVGTIPERLNDVPEERGSETEA